MKALIFRLLFIPVFVLFSTITLAVDDVVEHDLNVRLNPETHQLFVEDKITLPQNSAQELIFSLHSGLQLSSKTADVKITPLNHSNHTSIKQFKLQLPAQLKTFTLNYSGVINHQLEAYGKEQARGFRSTSGIISSQGVYLAASSHWFAQFNLYPYLRFNMRVTSPADWKSVSQGKRVTHQSTDLATIDEWDSQSPQEEIYLIAAPFTEYNQQDGKIDAQVFLRQPDAKLATKYLDATVRYVQMYEKLLGDYPYAKFALVENFWETGYGMPSFTLLGSKVIRLPFILNSSYPHEILHNWWGNGVYVDFDSGNWSEGLTAYLADHLIKQQQGKGAEYRLHGLQKYSDYASRDRDFALRQFRGRHSSATEAVGYGKTLMLFHMLRQQLGDEVFIKTLQQFYRDYRYIISSFDDIQNTFEQVSAKNLDRFFRQWVNRIGAPDLKLNNSKVTKTKDGYQLSFELMQVQSGENYHLQVPVAVSLDGQKKAFQTTLTLSEKTQQYTLPFKKRPVRIDIDPQFDLFRKLALEETPPAFTRLFGAKQLLVVLPDSSDPELKMAWEDFALNMKKMGPDSVSIQWDTEIAELPNNQAIAILGWKNRFVTSVIELLAKHDVSVKPDSLSIAGKSLSRVNHSLALISRDQESGNFPRALITTDNASALPGLARKLPHYHKYSYIAFEGNEPQNNLKGRWPVSGSPMTMLFDKNAQRAELAPRPALIDADSVFDADRMLQTVRTLAGEEYQGRGFTQPGLDKAAVYIAQAFKQAGLQAAGDHPGSYFQSWQDSGGEPAQQIVLKNVIGVIPGTHPKLKNENVVIGAHYDHLGFGWPDVKGSNLGKLHSGADDNASGVAVLLELARVLGRKLTPHRNIVFVAFSAEEAGRKGSKYYTRHQQKYPVQNSIGMLNLDTVGRLGNNKVLVLGAGSASEWPPIFRGVGFVTGIPIAMVKEELDSSDQISFHEAGVPAVQLFSGANLDYHRPSDTSDKIDSAGLVKIATISQQVIEYLASREQPLSSNLSGNGNAKQTKSATKRKVSLGSIPDFSYTGDGYRLDGVVAGSPAAIAGLQKGDIIVKLDNAEIQGLRDVSRLLKQMSAGQTLAIRYRRADKIFSTSTVLKSK